MSLSSLSSKPSGPPPSNRPPTPEYEQGEARVPGIAAFTSPASPASSPESPSRFSASHAKDLPPPPAAEQNRNAGKLTPSLAPAVSSPMLTEMPRRKPANTPSSVNSPATNKPPQSLKTASSFSADPNLSRMAARETRTPVSEPALSDKSRGSSVSPTRQRQDREQTPRQRPATDSRIVQTEKGPMYRGRDGTLYPEMAKLREPDRRAFRFPTWKGNPASMTAVEGVYSAREIKESHYSCFQKHATMNRRTNRHYPLTCQTCNKANADDRWACTFCHLRICEPCFRVLDTNQRDLKKLVTEIGRRTPLSLSSDSRPASAFGL
ncbi:hypothetical protein NLG97_g9395 [Lecanicillium saksenae]|uniref:Uncharacterized protein n=1 Tax=Lecanicillium saksenae TaxID=468837 RepID=A0ACC1QIV8_9HYPO|nr:hypothetical protein NLG97_g9395 [Lecanicillium saksenae]